MDSNTSYGCKFDFIDSESVKRMIPILTRERIRALTLCQCRFSADGVPALFDAIERFRIVKLSISACMDAPRFLNELGARETWRAIVERLAVNTSLRNLKLISFVVEERDVDEFAVVLSGLRVTHLSLWQLRIRDGWGTILDALSRVPLTSLEISDVTCPSRAHMLSAALSLMTNLRSVSLRLYEFDEAVRCDLIAMIETAPLREMTLAAMVSSSALKDFPYVVDDVQFSLAYLRSRTLVDLSPSSLLIPGTAEARVSFRALRALGRRSYAFRALPDDLKRRIATYLADARLVDGAKPWSV